VSGSGLVQWSPSGLKHLDELETVLQAQLAAITALNLWQPRKLGFLKLHQLTDIEAFNRQEEEQVGRIVQLESRRQVLMTLLQHEMGLVDRETVDLSALLAVLPEARAARLEQLRERILSVGAQLREAQSVVADLLKVSLAFVHHTMDVFAQLAQVAPNTGYGESGGVTSHVMGSFLLDQRA
jgi:hypothetical protein